MPLCGKRALRCELPLGWAPAAFLTPKYSLPSQARPVPNQSGVEPWG